MIVMIDNYDSFTYNLYQYIGHYTKDIKVFRNDEITVEEIEKMAPSHLIISPGPKYPKDAGISIAAIKHFTGKIPVLGICLGHQAIGEAFGGRVIRAEHILHGKTSQAYLKEDCDIFKGLGKEVTIARYHSLIVEKATLPDVLEVTATDEKGAIMALKHKTAPTYGLQFHPESILTEHGMDMIKNFLEVH